MMAVDAEVSSKTLGQPSKTPLGGQMWGRTKRAFVLYVFAGSPLAGQLGKGLDDSHTSETAAADAYSNGEQTCL